MDSKKPPFPPAGTRFVAEHVRKAVGAVVQRKAEPGKPPMAEHVRKAIGGVVQRKPEPGKQPMAEHVRRAIGGTVQAKRPAVAQRSWSRYSEFYSSDGGHGQDAEMYYHQEQQKDRARLEKEQRIRANAVLLQNYECRFYIGSYTGVEALVASIIKQECDPTLNDYSTKLVEWTQTAMQSQSPPAELSPQEILTSNNEYKTAVVETYERISKAKAGKTDTQIGLTADHASYK